MKGVYRYEYMDSLDRFDETVLPNKEDFYSSQMDGGNADKKANGTKKCVTKRILKFNDYKKCLLNNKDILKPQ